MYGQDSLIAGLKFCKHHSIRPFLDSWTALFLGWVWGRHENRPWGFRVTKGAAFLGRISDLDGIKISKASDSLGKKSQPR